MSLSALTTEYAKPIMTMMKNTQQFLDYATLNSDANLTYKASNMVLAVHSNASCLNKQKVCNRVGGHLFLSTTATFLPNNGVILNTVPVIKAVMFLVAEAELGTLFINAKQAPSI